MFFNIEKKDADRLAAISDDGKTITYGELIQTVNDIKNVIGTRNLVFILCRNVIASLVGYVSMLGSENVPLLLSAELDEELLGYLLETYKPNYIWCPEGINDRFGELKNNNISLYSFDDYSLLRYSEEKAKLFDDLALLLTTSGSTGSPKLVRQSYNNIIANAKSIVEYLEIDSSERPITMLPMNYTYGLSVINSHLLCGATILMTESGYTQRPFWNFFREKQATSIVGVPYTYEILKKLRFFRMKLPSLRYMTQAGGKLLPELHKEFAEYALENNVRFYVMYGQTEATARMSYLPYEKSLEKYGSMGIAIPGGEFSLIDVEGNEIDEADTIGELVYKGPNVTLGYAECKADLAKGDERHGTLVTGDMAKRDAEGYYYIVGRKKRFLKIYGNRVNLDECERLIQSEYEDVECACVGEDDHMRIFVTSKGIEDSVLNYISEKTGLNRKAFEVNYIEFIPKNESGKKLYKNL